VILDLLAAIATIALLLLAQCTRPDHATFGAGWINGIRPDGAYELRRQPANPDDETPPGVLRGRIFCTGGTRAIVIDHRTVGCQR
jgi:hypothetical protein